MNYWGLNFKTFLFGTRSPIFLKHGMDHFRLNVYKDSINYDPELTLSYFMARSNCVCGTVSFMLSGLETRSLGLNTLDTT